MSEQEDDPRRGGLLRLAREVTGRHDLDDVLAATFREMREVVSFAGGSIQLIDDEGWISVAASDPPVPPDGLDSRVPLGNSVAGRVVLTERSISVHDVRCDGRAVVQPAREWGESVRSYLAVPLLADGRAIGVLRIDAHHPDAFDEPDRGFMIGAGVVVAAAIQNARAHARLGAASARIAALEQQLSDATRPEQSESPTVTL
jgi:GAF domain-containing protein